MKNFLLALFVGSVSFFVIMGGISILVIALDYTSIGEAIAERIRRNNKRDTFSK